MERALFLRPVTPAWADFQRSRWQSDRNGKLPLQKCICKYAFHWKFFHFLWRNLEIEREPDVHEFERIVFGDASALFIAQFVSQENAENHKEEFPLAAETVKKSMDDSLDSGKTVATAIELFRQLPGLWGKAGMLPRKWLSNSPAVLKVIPKDHLAAEVDLDRHSLPAAKTLGLLWLATSDRFSFQVSAGPITTQFTKRTVLSKVAMWGGP